MQLLVDVTSTQEVGTGGSEIHIIFDYMIRTRPA